MTPLGVVELGRQVMACRLFGANPSPQLMLNYCQGTTAFSGT